MTPVIHPLITSCQRCMLSVVLSVLTAAATAYPGEANVLSSEALNKYKAGDYAKAQDLYTQAEAKDPKRPELKFGLGSSLFKDGKIEKAIESFKSVFDQTNKNLNASSRFNTGVAHHTLARKAMDEMQKSSGAGASAGAGDAAKAARDTAIEKLEAALPEYKSAIIGATTDRDMKFNYELARRELDELKRQKQQEEQQQNQQNKQDQKNQKDQQQQKPDQKKDDQNKQQQNQKDKQDQKDQKNPQQQNQDQKKDQKDNKPDQQQPDQKQDQKDDKSDEQKPQDGKNNKQDKQQQPKDCKDESDKQDTPVGEMSPQDVERLLNSLPPEDQKALQRFYNQKFQTPDNMERDW